jgi:hypothetical protein
LQLVFTTSIVVFRLWIQNFSTPEFRPEDNPIAAIDGQLMRFVNQNYLFVLNFWLLLMPEWLSFDWSFASIEIIEGFVDVRVGLVGVFYVALVWFVLVGAKMR